MQWSMCLTFYWRHGEIGLVEDAHGHVKLAVFDPGVRTDGRLAASAEDFQELTLGDDA
jgi:hypothetical protein